MAKAWYGRGVARLSLGALKAGQSDIDHATALDGEVGALFQGFAPGRAALR
jgi:hypothetical protein